MNKQKIRIKSSQIFEEHVDSIEEEYECTIEKFENVIKIVYDNSVITIQDKIVMIDREKGKLVIEDQIRNCMKYETPYGTIDIETQGKEIQLIEAPFILKLSYYIRVGNAKEYVNELQIVVVE